MRLALVGAGRLAAHLGLALQALGQAPVALGARNRQAAAPLAQALGLCVCTPEEAQLGADVVMLAVRDEAIAPLAAALPWRAGQLAVHASGATELEALAPAERRAGFHPLQLFADPLPRPEAALAAFAGVRIGIEGDADATLALSSLATRLGAIPLLLVGGQRARYHAAANLAASGLFAPLQAAVTLWREALGLDEAQAWAALQPLAKGALAAASERGLAGALSGPLARGDTAVLARHLEALKDRPVAPLYLEAMRTLLPLARESGRLDAEQWESLFQLLSSQPAKDV